MISSKGESGGDRPSLQGRGMMRTEATRRPQNTRQGDGAAATSNNYELNTGSMFQYGEGKQNGDTGAINLKMRQLYGVNPKVKPAVLAIDEN